MDASTTPGTPRWTTDSTTPNHRVPNPMAGVTSERRERAAGRRGRRAAWTTAIALGAILTVGPPVAAFAVFAAADAQVDHSEAIPTLPAPPDESTTTPRGPETADPSSTSAAIAASAEQSTGIVLIDTVLGYQNGVAAGTGIVLTDDGLVLTNNHVIQGSTEIAVTLADGGTTYSARVVGVDVEDDIAVLQLDGASGLTTAPLDDDATTIGDAVTAVGNAEGGGTLMAATGQITALDASVTAATSLGDARTLDGMIQFGADVVSGDSGGALLDSEGEVTGVTTAASSGTTETLAYAIPIDDATTIVTEILNGDTANGATIGYPAFLGVVMSGSTATGPTAPGATPATIAGAAIAGVVSGTPAADAGIVAGDTITAIDGTAIADAASLSATIATYAPGDQASVTWIDANGTTQSATVTFIEGPAA